MPEDYATLNALLEKFHEDQKLNPETNWSWPRIAAAMDISKQSLNNWRANRPGTDIKRINNIVAQFLQTQLKRDIVPKTVPFKETTATEIMFDILQVARIQREFCAVVSKAGYGKTESIRQYVKDHHDVVLIEGRPSQQSHMLLYELAECLKVSRKNNSDMIYKRIVEKLKATPKLLIFDEAQFYRYKTLEVIRRIHDTAGVGVVLCGSYVLWDQMVGKDVKDFDQLLSRTIKRELPELNADDVQLLLEDVFTGEINESTISDLLTMCKGSARSLVKNLSLAQSLMDAEKVDMQSIKQAHKFLLQAA